ncbi:nucleotidyltransferase [uncultured Clostridium sp.]|jgi:predicted nucleotidyltransferase|uniref:nucleotidyltransferase n=1 Tax=uncultured Clostridium sp. TaxID=59620 RepID=UPI002614488C|nr:nucleotidyltransferase [uncultured Clostridium sp.]
MKISGIITEYNPFHSGHKFHLNNCKNDTKSDAVICIMSGNFVQRGIPAITDKWSRAQMAIDSGVDLVIELPTLYAVSSAEHFAFGAISLLDSINVVDNIYFGSEAGSVELIMLVAKILAFEPLEFKNSLKDSLSLGLPFPKARAKSLDTYIRKYSNANIDISNLETFLNSSNNILGIEYCKNILRLNSKIKPLTLKREGSNYNDIKTRENSFASATAIRTSILSTQNLNSIKEFLPISTFNILNTKNNFTNPSSMFNYIRYQLMLYPSIITQIPDASEGLDNKILNEIKQAENYEDLLNRCKSKRYTHTRISRILCHVFLGIDKVLYDMLKERPNYIRVLALNKKGGKVLKKIKDTSDIEIITKVPRKISNPLLALDVKATNLYSLLNPSLKESSDYLLSPIIKKD